MEETRAAGFGFEAREGVAYNAPMSERLRVVPLDSESVPSYKTGPPLAPQSKYSISANAADWWIEYRGGDAGRDMKRAHRFVTCSEVIDTETKWRGIYDEGERLKLAIVDALGRSDAELIPRMLDIITGETDHERFFREFLSPAFGVDNPAEEMLPDDRVVTGFICRLAHHYCYLESAV